MRSLLLATALLATPGCIYQHTTEPFDVNFNATKMAEGRPGDLDIKHLRIWYAQFEWDSNAYGDIARKYGIETLYFADLETLSILNGLWKQQYIHLYGTEKKTATAAP